MRAKRDNSGIFLGASGNDADFISKYKLTNFSLPYKEIIWPVEILVQTT